MMNEPSPSLWVIDPSMAVAEEEGVRNIVSGWTGDWRLFRPVLSPHETPPWELGYAFDGLVIMGSRASVTESLPWLERLSQWMQPLVDGELERPVLGICFGHQLLGHLAGGEVGLAFEGGEKRVAIEETQLSDGRISEAGSTLRVVVSHREGLVRCPPNYRVFARREGVPFDGIEHTQRPLFGVQFHPEAGTEFALHSGLEPEAVDDQVRADGQGLVERFTDLILRRGTSREP